MHVSGEGQVLEYVGLGDGGAVASALLLQPVKRLLHPEHRVVVVAVVVRLSAELEAVARCMCVGMKCKSGQVYASFYIYVYRYVYRGGVQSGCASAHNDLIRGKWSYLGGEEDSAVCV